LSFRLKKNAGIGSLGSAFGESEVGSDSNRFGPSHRPPSIERGRPRHSRVMGWAWEFPHRTGGGGMGERGSRRAETAGGLRGKQVWALVWGKSVVWFAWGKGLTAGGGLGRCLVVRLPEFLASRTTFHSPFSTSSLHFLIAEQGLQEE